MSLDKSRIPKLSDSSRKFIPEKQRKTMIDPFVERIARTRTDKGKKVSGGMVETRSQKSRKSYFYKPGGLPIRKGPNFVIATGGPILPIRSGPFLPIRKGPILSIRRGPILSI